MNRPWVPLLAAAALLLGGCDDPAPRSSSAEPLGTGTSDPQTKVVRGPRLERLVDDERSVLLDLAVSPRDPAVRASLWRFCERRSCASSRTVVAVTADAFRHRAVVSWDRRDIWWVAPAGRTSFVVRTGGRALHLVDAHGRVVDLPAPGPARPLRPGEVVSPWGRTAVGIDPRQGTSHRLSGASGVQQLRQQGLRVEGLWQGRHGWSDDGGATWQRVHTPDPHGLYGFVDAPAGEHLLVRGADGATLFPLVAIDRLAGGRWESVAGPEDPTAYVGATAVLPDGSLVTAVQAWSDERRIGHVRTEPGLYRTEGADWSRWGRVAAAAPDGADHFQPEVLLLRSSARGVEIIVGGEGGTAFRTTDLGVTWQPFTAR